jgi:3-oxoacyl-[acyl-carrier protein] reductase
MTIPFQEPVLRVPENARLCVFGLGVLALECFGQLAQMLGRVPDCLCDNDPSKWGTLHNGIRCLSPGELAGLAGEVFVVVAARAPDAIVAQLRSMGCRQVAVVDYERAYDRIRALRDVQGPEPAASIRSIQGRWALITGASRGLGRLLAVEMAHLGAHLVLAAREVSHLETTAQACAPFGGQVVCLGADLGDPAQALRLAQEVGQIVPDLEILYNNAGISPPSSSGFWEMSPGDYLSSFRVNALAPLLLSQTIIPAMTQRGSGRIVNVSSSIQGCINEMAYACSKAALDKFTRDMAIELSGTGVMISSVDPGWLRTDMGGALAPCEPESALPGLLLGALLDVDVNGRWIRAQDYVGLDLESAARKAAIAMGLCAMETP